MGSLAIDCSNANDGKSAVFNSVKVYVIAFVTEVASEIVGGKGGGGRPDFAQAGGVDISKIDEALKKVKSLI